ncbi:MAG TPA: hypothetical protein PKD45_04200 [Flavobacteriales bacterium]|nr:hypothetical protein [Flavobacteriales bacterium]
MGQAGTCLAQGKDKSLTKEFDKLSAKERSRIAARETAEADSDSTYQRLMRKGDELFRAGSYDEALSVFGEARALRPYNVYPKVKMEDLQALIRKRDGEARREAAPVAAEMVPPEEVPAPVVGTPAPPPPVAAPPATAVTPAVAPSPGRPPVGVVHPAPAPAPPPPPPALGERVYLEGGAVVTERTVEDDGKMVIYKKVAHNWGQTFYFKEGSSIPERQWKERFTESP